MIYKTGPQVDFTQNFQELTDAVYGSLTAMQNPTIWWLCISAPASDSAFDVNVSPLTQARLFLSHF